MDRLTSRIRCNSDGSIVFRHSDNSLVIKGRSDALLDMENKFVSTKTLQKHVHSQLFYEIPVVLEAKEKGSVTDLDEDISTSQKAILNQGWETEIEYY
ncbi:hypothetical protein [Lederbergia lenta]|uniref:hypothetical protein n=1 Tax=Lederbergia lenta TaxID=1467 RepID=UPI00203D09B1|nr:hypothetical protein [Lederbergia lenta]MCM3111017.1 hypothetical protein [Lederbergia lenta]